MGGWGDGPEGVKKPYQVFVKNKSRIGEMSVPEVMMCARGLIRFINIQSAGFVGLLSEDTRLGSKQRQCIGFQQSTKACAVYNADRHTKWRYHNNLCV